MNAKDIRLTDEQKERLAALAEKKGETWRQVLDAFLAGDSVRERNESVLDAAIRLGVSDIHRGMTAPAEGGGKNMRKAIEQLAEKAGFDLQ